MIYAIDVDVWKADAEVGSLTRAIADSFGTSVRGVGEVLDAIVISGRHE